MPHFDITVISAVLADAARATRLEAIDIPAFLVSDQGRGEEKRAWTRPGAWG